MYNSQSFEEAAFGIYLMGMLDYKRICERLFMERYDDPSDLKEVLDDAQREFEETAGMKL